MSGRRVGLEPGRDVPERGGLGPDGLRLFLARALRMLAYGGLAVVLVVYLERLGLGAATIGVLLTLTLIGDTLISLWLTTHADRIGRRKVLVAGAFLMAGAAVVFSLTDLAPLLLIAAMIGVLSPSGKEVGPFLAVEQASLTRLVPDRRRTSVFAWYNLVGSVMAAIGALAAGLAVQVLRGTGLPEVDADRAVVLAYGAVGIALALVFAGLSSAVEVPHAERSTVAGRLGLHRSRGVVARLSALFALDAFAGGFILDSLVAYWFATRFSVEPAVIGAIFFGTNLLAAFSALAAARLAARIGLIRTMVYTHLPSNVLLILVPLMPTVGLAILALLARSTISQMDVPTRQSYTMAVVDPDERSAAAGVTGIARTTGQAISPLLAAPIVASAAFAGAGFVIAGSLKIVYDLSLWALFRARPAPEEAAKAELAREAAAAVEASPGEAAPETSQPGGRSR
jgi:MFS family permease